MWMAKTLTNKNRTKQFKILFYDKPISMMKPTNEHGKTFISISDRVLEKPLSDTLYPALKIKKNYMTHITQCQNKQIFQWHTVGNTSNKHNKPKWPASPPLTLSFNPCTIQRLSS